ncbi:hypothetical protein M0804_013548 [Polistes exclamans]|nr:hypothetical protein M0804_013548 [Polistes exclamans]
MNFKQTLESKLNCNIPLKTPLQIEQTANTLTDVIQEAALAFTNQILLPKQILTYPSINLQKIKVKCQSVKPVLCQGSELDELAPVSSKKIKVYLPLLKYQDDLWIKLCQILIIHGPNCF